MISGKLVEAVFWKQVLLNVCAAGLRDADDVELT